MFVWCQHNDTQNNEFISIKVLNVTVSINDTEHNHAQENNALHYAEYIKAECRFI